MMIAYSVDIALDYNGDCRLRLAMPEGKLAQLACFGQTEGRLCGHIRALLRVERAGDGVRVRLGDLHCADVLLSGDDYTISYHQRLSVFETRALSVRHNSDGLPYPRRITSEQMRLSTDLHTHSSSQISAQALLAVGLRHGVAYPVQLLDILGITYNNADIVEAKPVFFAPTDAGKSVAENTVGAVPLHTLSPVSFARLEAALSIPGNCLATFGELEMQVYRFRKPLTHKPELAAAIWRETAREYRAQGIAHAEITVTANTLLDRDYLAVLENCLPSIEEETGVRLIFLAGLPRNMSQAAIGRLLDLYMRFGVSPYIGGIDVIGYEDNKTEDVLLAHMPRLAEWVHAHDPEFTLRIHAGENRKNRENVAQALTLAERYGVHVRVAHVLHGLDSGVWRLAEMLAARNQIVLEFIPDSNLALNNIDDAAELPVREALSRHIPTVIGSDGAGLYRTDARQLALAAHFSGLTADDFNVIRHTEQEYIARQRVRFERKQRSLSLERRGQEDRAPIPVSTFHGEESERPQRMLPNGVISDPEAVEALVEDRVPLLIAGASGAQHWHSIGEVERAEITALMEWLAEAVDGKRAYFVIGRLKEQGVGNVLIRALDAAKARHAGREFPPVVAVVARGDEGAMRSRELPDAMIVPDIPLFAVPEALIGQVAARGGAALFIGGGSFTRDAIKLAAERELPLLLMRDSEGASAEKARLMSEEYSFSAASEAMERLHKAVPGFFLKKSRRINPDSG